MPNEFDPKIFYYKFPYGMNADMASSTIRKAFPKGLFRRRKNVSVSFLYRALMYARTVCASEELDKCIEWAWKRV